MMSLNFLRGKKIAIVGFGVNNRQLAEYLKTQGINYDIIDNWNNPDELTGKLDRYEVIFRTPGLPFLSKAVQQAKMKGIEISSQTKLFFDLCKAKIIGVTGTKGKGTTAALIFEILKAAGKKVWLAGNIGKDPFEFLDQVRADDLVILELSSFQLQDLHKSPQIAVITNFSPDHLNHHQTITEYAFAKTMILTHQTTHDFAVLNQSLPDNFKQAGQGKKIFFSAADAKDYETRLLGPHNLEDIAAAVKVAEIFGVDEDSIKKTVAVFSPLPHRLNIICTINGITYIDDAFSTNIGPVIGAIDAMAKPTVLIVGGYDKGLDYSMLAQKIKSSKQIKALVVIGQVTAKILESIKGFGGAILTGAKNMQEIIAQAKSAASIGDTILFSPGTASFDMFENEMDRGEQFVRAVRELM